MANHSKGGIVILYYIQNEIEMLESALVHLDEELEILPHADCSPELHLRNQRHFSAGGHALCGGSVE